MDTQLCPGLPRSARRERDLLKAPRSGVGRWGHSSGTRVLLGRVGEDELQFQLPAAFLDSWTSAKPRWTLPKKHKPSSQMHFLGRPEAAAAVPPSAENITCSLGRFPTPRGDSRWGHTVSDRVPQPPALPDGFPPTKPRELPEAALVLAQLSTPQSK